MSVTAGDATSTGPRSLPRAERAAAPGVNVVRGLLWRQWLAHRTLIVGWLAVWLILGWVLLLLCHPNAVMGLGILYVLLAAPVFAGLDTVEGSEEFSFALPPTRSRRYLTRLGMGLGTVLVFTGAAVLAVWLDLPQRLWGLVVESGFTEPFVPVPNGWVYVLVVVLPMSAFCFGFALASVASSRVLVGGAGLAGVICAGIVTALGIGAEVLLWNDANGFIVCPVLLASGAMVLLLGHAVYVRKEGVSRPTPMDSGGWRWWIAGIVVLALLLFLFALFALSVRVHETSSVRERAERRATAAGVYEEAMARQNLENNLKAHGVENWKLPDNLSQSELSEEHDRRIQEQILKDNLKAHGAQSGGAAGPRAAGGDAQEESR